MLFQALGRTLLGLQVAGVAGGQRQQIAAPEERQQSTEQDDEHQVHGNRHPRQGADLFVTGNPQLLLHADEGSEFLTDLVGDALAATGADRFLVVTVLTAQTDHLAGKGIPLLLQRHQALQPVDLLRIVGHHRLQAHQAGQHLWLGHLVRFEKALVSGDQEAAHAGFHIDRQLDRLVGVVDHPVGMFHPLNGRQQVIDHGDEHDSAEQADAQRQADVAAQQLAKALLIYRGWLNHHIHPSK
ncbi:hypothetical protein D3C78_524150 [compost metagenome]